MHHSHDRPKPYTEVSACRLCRGTNLVLVLDLGEQVLSGRFPLADEPDPPSAPLQLVRCGDWSCGLVQLKHTVEPLKMFSEYFYRSSISATMRDHLRSLAEEAQDALAAKGPIRVLDIGGNDGLLLSFLHTLGEKTLVDPSDVPVAYPGISKVKGLFPSDYLLTQTFDLIFSIACYYDSDAPVHFAQSVKRILSENGLWVVEVADVQNMLANVAYDAIVSEHLLYLSAYQMSIIAREAGLKIVRSEANNCNGGSIRHYLSHQWSRKYDEPKWKAGVSDIWQKAAGISDLQFDRFARAAIKSKDDLGAYVEDCRAAGKRIHLLGASTKSGTILQWAGLTSTHIEAASDRDERKLGRVMPGSRVPIVSEDVSRKMGPDVYLSCLPWAGTEVLNRERAAGNKAEIVAILPELKVLG